MARRWITVGAIVDEDTLRRLKMLVLEKQRNGEKITLSKFIRDAIMTKLEEEERRKVEDWEKVFRPVVR